MHVFYLLNCTTSIKYFHIVHTVQFTDKKENQIFLIYHEIQNGAVAKSYMTSGLIILVKYLHISYDFATDLI